MTITCLDDLMVRYRAAHNPNTGRLYSSSARRAGVTGKPIAMPELVGVLHASINLFKWTLQVIAHINW